MDSSSEDATGSALPGIIPNVDVLRNESVAGQRLVGVPGGRILKLSRGVDICSASTVMPLLLIRKDPRESVAKRS